ncbi:MAG: PAS domain S-box protein [Planctomycetota bacterium]|nr:PAS domain S-box protein [Planctomycetota bacterium]
MTAMIILGLSVVLQIAAVVLALRLIPLTGRRGAWVLISAGMLLIVVRRALHIVQVVREVDQPSPSEATEAMMNLALSLLFLVGVHRIRSVFESHFKVQAQRQASEERFRLAFENARDAIFWADADTGVLINCNRAAEALVGRPRAEILGQPQTFLHPVEDVDRQREVFRAFTQEGAKGLVELEVLRKDGRRVPVEISGAITEIAGQRIAQGIFLDITGRKRAEHALVASERKYRLLHESMTDAFVLVGMDGRIREFNRAYMDMLGYKVQEIYQLNYVDITPAKWHDFEAEIVRSQILPRGHSGVYCKEYRRKDGSVFPVELRTFLLRDGAGQPAGMWAIVRDVTEREAAVAAIRQAREDLEVRVRERTAELSQTVAALRESEQRYRQLFGTVPDAVLAFDMETGQCIDMNQAAERMFGYTAPEAHAVNVLDVSAEPERTKADSPRIAAEGKIVSIPLRQCRRKDGTVFPAEASVGTFVAGGRRLVCGVFRDITERLQTQAHLAESRDRLRSVLASMDDMLFVYDKEGRFIDYYCQPDELDRLYAPPEQFLGKHYREVLPANVSELIDGAIEALRQTGKVQQIEYAIEVAGRRRWVAGRQRWSNAKVSLWKDARDEVGGMTVVVRDVTERVRAEQDVRDSEARYRGLFEQSPVAMWEMDFSPLRPYVAGLRARGVQDLRKHFQDNPGEVNDLLSAGRVLAINQATVRMEGVATKAEVLAHTGPDAPETRTHMVESRIALAEGQTAVQIQQRGYTASGRTMEGILDYLVLPGHEQTLDRVLVAITDVTAIKEAQEKLEEMARFPMEGVAARAGRRHKNGETGFPMPWPPASRASTSCSRKTGSGHSESCLSWGVGM